MKFSLNTQIFLGALLGVGYGIFLNISTSSHPLFAPSVYFSEIVGGIFVNLLKMILIPLIFTSIVTGIANLRQHQQMSKVWKITMVFFLCTPIIATTLGIVAMNIFQPGVGLNLDLFKEAMASYESRSLTLGQFAKQFFSDLFVNPVAAMAQMNVLATLIFAMFLGVGLVSLGERTKNLLFVFNELFEVIMLIVSWIMRLAPIGIMALLIKLIATQNVALFSALGKYVSVVIGATLLHGFVILPLILFFFTRMNPIEFYSGIKEAMITALATSSSSATMPVTLRCLENNLKVDKNIAGFVVPIGTTINMDGTAIYEAMAALFIANLVGIDLNLIQQIVVCLTAMIASVGAPGIPSAGMVTMVMVLQSVGLPVEAIAILLPIDRPLDAIRTSVNVEGDAIGSLIVQKFTK